MGNQHGETCLFFTVTPFCTVWFYLFIFLPCTSMTLSRFIHIFARVCVCVYIYIIYACTYIYIKCVHVYICTSIYMHIHTHTYTHILNDSSWIWTENPNGFSFHWSRWWQDPPEHSSTIFAGRDRRGIRSTMQALQEMACYCFFNSKATSLFPHRTLANHPPGNLKSSRKIFIPSTMPGSSFAVCV